MLDCIRKRIEIEEEERLSPFAAKSRLSRGRLCKEQECPVRTVYQRDRDRIIHSKSFRRLKHKTQVFIAPLGDHYVTRLTHTLEVSQIARTIARALRLNEDLAEAISLGHDLGHTPFGHIGEDALNQISPSGFKHNEQSLRIVEKLEKQGKGLNLTFEVREGILLHSKAGTNIFDEGWEIPRTLEGQICKVADIIAYVNHDMSDAIRADVLQEDDLPEITSSVLGKTHSERIDTMVKDVISSSLVNWKNNEYTELNRPQIRMSLSVQQAANMLRNFLYENVYVPSIKKKEARIAREVISVLWDYFLKNSQELAVLASTRQDPVEQRVADYIAGMTDQFALFTARRITGKRFSIGFIYGYS